MHFSKVLVRKARGLAVLTAVAAGSPPAFPGVPGSHAQAWMSQGGNTEVGPEEMQVGRLGGDRNRGLRVSLVFVHSHGQGSQAQVLLFPPVSAQPPVKSHSINIKVCCQCLVGKRQYNALGDSYKKEGLHWILQDQMMGWS